MLGPLQLLALRENAGAIQALCAMIEVDVVDGAAAAAAGCGSTDAASTPTVTDDMRMQMIAALQSTPTGRKQYGQLCDRQSALKELASFD